MDERRRWQVERQSAWLYRIVARCEPDPVKRRMFLELANAAEKQAELIAADHLKAGGKPPSRFRPNLRARVVAAWVRVLGPRRARPLLAAMKVRGVSVYGGAPPPEDGHPMPTAVEEVGGRHRRAGSGGNLRAAVFGVSDGLVSNTSLIMGIAGATLDSGVLLTAGIAGLLAGAFSMAAGEYVSVRSQRELYESQIAEERDEVERYPDEEAEELALIYAARGVPLEQARQMTRLILQDQAKALDTLAREELGVNPAELGSPWGAALSSFVAFAGGAFVPILPFLWSELPWQVGWSAVLAGVSLFAVGTLLSLFSGRNALWGGLRMVLIGGAAGVATHFIGKLLGVTLS